MSNEVQVNVGIPLRNLTVGFVWHGFALHATELMAGLQAGLIACLTMAGVSFFFSALLGLGVWSPFNDVANLIVPSLIERGVSYTPLAIPLVMVGHVTLSILLSLIFTVGYNTFLKPTVGYDRSVTLVAGALFGFFTWLGCQVLILPSLSASMANTPAFLLAHIIFGATLGLLYPLMPAHRTLKVG